ncbi:MAG: mechanosensitive ion channel [Phycisphaeraceae bacterium]|nr:mechanosensitive ion channel [Phycisphaeraceae bacterium]
MLDFNLLAQADGTAEAPPAEPTGEQQVNEAAEQGKEAVGGLMQGDFSQATQLLIDWGPKVAGALIILVASFIIGKIISRIVCRSAEKAKIDLTLSRFFGKMVYYLVLVVGVMIALGTVGVEVTSFAAILAAAGFAVGMAMSGTLGNFANGVMLLIFRPFDVGDVISAAGVTAKVNAIELFTTTLDTGDNRRIIVPNSSIYGGTIENITHHDERRCDVNVGCDYSADIDKTREVLSKAAESLDEKLLKGEGRGYQIVLGDLGDSSVNWTVRFWCLASDYWPLKEALTRAIKMHLDEAGIGIPFPQMDVHLDKAGE